VQFPTAYDRRAGDFKLAVDLGAAGEIRGGGQYFRDDDVPRYDRIESGRNEIYLFDPQERTLGYARYDVNIEPVGNARMAATFSRMVQTEGRWLRSTGSTTDRLELDEVTTHGFGVQLTWPEYFRQQWTAGIEVYDDSVRSERVDENFASGSQRARRGRFPDGAGYRSTAVYAQSRVHATSRLDVLLGARYSRFSADAFLEDFGGDYAATFDDLTGSAHAVFLLSPEWQVSGGIAKGFRAPGLDDATVFGEFNAGIEIPNPDLRPERVINYEAKIKALYAKLWFSATAFDSHLSDLIARAPGTYQGSPIFDGEPVFQRQNIDSARIHGAELDAHYWPAERLEAAATLTVTHGANEANGDPLRRIPPLFGRLSGKWRFDWNLSWVGAYIDYATKQGRLAPGDVRDTRIPDGGTPGYAIVSLSAGATLLQNWQVNAVFYNLGDTDYRIHGSGINGPGRSLRLFIRGDFGR
jgi:outer membrane receptor protein involved in Fe transport